MRVRALFPAYRQRQARATPPGYPHDPQTLGEHLKKRRMDLRLYQTEVATLLRVDAETIGNWEDGSTYPRIRSYPAIIAFLGFSPFEGETETFGGKITAYKKEHGLSTKKLAKLLGVDEGTVSKWVRNECVPLARSREKVFSIITNTTAQ